LGYILKPCLFIRKADLSSRIDVLFIANPQFLKVISTIISEEIIATIKIMEQLKKLYRWDTEFSAYGLSGFRKNCQTSA